MSRLPLLAIEELTRVARQALQEHTDAPSSGVLAIVLADDDGTVKTIQPDPVREETPPGPLDVIAGRMVTFSDDFGRVRDLVQALCVTVEAPDWQMHAPSRAGVLRLAEVVTDGLIDIETDLRGICDQLVELRATDKEGATDVR